MRAALPFTTALCLLLACAAARARQEAQGPPPQPARGAPVDYKLCPTIQVSCPAAIPGPNLPVTFKAQVRGAGPSPSLTFMWVTSAGVFNSAQKGVIDTTDAEREIVVDTTGVPSGQAVTVTFEVGGLDRSCPNSASCSTALLGGHHTRPVDVYGDIKFGDEKARLDNLAIKLQNDPSTHGYIVCYGGRVGRRGEARARCERAKKHLIERRGVAPGRLVTVDGGFMEDLSVWLWALPPGANFSPSPTVDPSEVRFTDTRRRPRRPARKRS